MMDLNQGARSLQQWVSDCTLGSKPKRSKWKADIRIIEFERIDEVNRTSGEVSGLAGVGVQVRREEKIGSIDGIENDVVKVE